jgi:hypothetical protein
MAFPLILMDIDDLSRRWLHWSIAIDRDTSTGRSPDLWQLIAFYLSLTYIHICYL